MPCRPHPWSPREHSAATQVRLKRVTRTLAQWDAYEQGKRAQREGLSRASLLNLQAMLEQVIRERWAAGRLRTWKRRN